ncbi:hypothetical protein STENM327S_04458 [Streptomyces tendae]
MNPMNRRGFVAAAVGAAAATVPVNAPASEASPGRGASGTPSATHTGDPDNDDCVSPSTGTSTMSTGTFGFTNGVLAWTSGASPDPETGARP